MERRRLATSACAGQVQGLLVIEEAAMNRTQRYLLIAALVGSGIGLGFTLDERIAVLLEQNKDLFPRSAYDYYTLLYEAYGVPRVLVGYVAPQCLFAAALFVALFTKTRR
jgi:hypothetical protein